MAYDANNWKLTPDGSGRYYDGPQDDVWLLETLEEQKEEGLPPLQRLAANINVNRDAANGDPTPTDVSGGSGSTYCSPLAVGDTVKLARQYMCNHGLVLWSETIWVIDSIMNDTFIISTDYNTDKLRLEVPSYFIEQHIQSQDEVSL